MFPEPRFKCYHEIQIYKLCFSRLASSRSDRQASSGSWRLAGSKSIHQRSDLSLTFSIGYSRGLSISSSGRTLTKHDLLSHDLHGNFVGEDNPHQYVRIEICGSHTVPYALTGRKTWRNDRKDGRLHYWTAAHNLVVIALSILPSLCRRDDTYDYTSVTLSHSRSASFCSCATSRPNQGRRKVFLAMTTVTVHVCICTRVHCTLISCL